MSNSTLGAIRQKARRLTRSPSEAQLSTAELDQYINTFILYDFPEHLRLFSLRTNLIFYTQPGVDVYQTTTVDPLDPLYNFKNKYIAVHPPVFISGVQSFFTQYRDVFYGQWPQTNAVVDTLIDGDGSTGPFSGIVPSFPPAGTPVTTNSGRILHNSVIFTALDTGGTAMVIVDYPVSNTTGALGLPNQPQTLPSPYGQINYTTGAFTLNFPNNTLAGITNPIYAEYVPFVAGKPLSVLYYDNQFTLRPVPDKSYPVQIEVDIRPTELLDQAVSPQIEQWWQFIAIGASKKIFEDRMDMDSVGMLMPEFMKQMNLVNRTSLTQQANMRAPTIYTIGRQYWGWGGSGSNFPF